LAPPPDAATWYHLKSVALGNGPPCDVSKLDLNKDKEGDSVGVVESWTWPDPLADVTGNDFDAARLLINAGTWREHPQAKQWVGIPVAQALGLDLTKSSDKAKVAGVIKAWLAAGSLEVYEASDENRVSRTFVRVKEDDE
jgi:hypothetical protein